MFLFRSKQSRPRKRESVYSSHWGPQRWLQLQYWPGVEGLWRLSRKINSHFPLRSKIITSSCWIAHIFHKRNVCLVTKGQSVKLREKTPTAPTDRVTLRVLIMACLQWEIFMTCWYCILTFWLISQVSHLRIRNRSSSCYCWQMSHSLSPESTLGLKHENVY